MPKLTIVAHITAKADQADFVRTELEKLIAPTHQEEGCVQYDLHVDNDNPAYFMFFENWDSRELWQQHMSNPPLKNFLAVTEGAVEELKVHEMTKIG